MCVHVLLAPPSVLSAWSTALVLWLSFFIVLVFASTWNYYLTTDICHEILGPSTRHVYKHTHCVHTCARLVRGPSTYRQTHTHKHILIYLVVGVTKAWALCLPPPPPWHKPHTTAQRLPQILGYTIHHLQLPETLDTYYILRHTMHAMTSQQTHFTPCTIRVIAYKSTTCALTP